VFSYNLTPGIDVAKTTDISWEKLCEGPNGEVWILSKCAKELEKLKQPELRAKALANMRKRFCKFEDLADLTPSQFKLNEGRQKHEGKEVMVSAFKGGDLRIYGSVGTVKGNRAFFATHAIYKKANKLDTNDAKLAVRRLVSGISEIPGAQI